MDNKVGKAVLLGTLVAAGAVAIGSSTARPPPIGNEQFEEWYAEDGSLNGYRHWTCDGRMEVWGTFQGDFVLTRRACPGQP